jgi:hypothetical protein
MKKHNFGVKFPDGALVDLGGLLRAALEDVHGTVQQRFLPLVDHGSGVSTF